MSDKPVVELISHDGNAFRVWADGRTEGFPDGIMINRIPSFANERAAQYLAARQPEVAR